MSWYVAGLNTELLGVENAASLVAAHARSLGW
jgi:hypothetical protein